MDLLWHHVAHFCQTIYNKNACQMSSSCNKALYAIDVACHATWKSCFSNIIHHHYTFSGTPTFCQRGMSHNPVEGMIATPAAIPRVVLQGFTHLFLIWLLSLVYEAKPWCLGKDAADLVKRVLIKKLLLGT